MSLRDQFGPLRLLIGGEDYSQLLTDGATWSSVDPGGYEAASWPLPQDAPNILRGAHVLLTSGLQTAWEGRVSQPQRSLGHQTLLQCEGYGARFTDEAGSMIFVDRDLTRWGDPSYTRQAAIATGYAQLGSSQVAADPTSNTPALVQSITDSWASPFTPQDEAWYDAGPQNTIAQIYYALTTGLGGAPWFQAVFVSNDANASTLLDVNVTGGGTGYFTPGSQYRFAFVQHEYQSTPAGTQGAIFNAYWQNLAVYGPHGLPGRGPDPVGYYPSDIFSWAVAQIPDLQPGVIQTTDASDYIIPHSVYYTPVNLNQIISDMATAQGWHWGVWGSLAPLTGDPRPRADFRPRPAPGAFTAFCLRRDCDTFDIREDLSQQYNVCTCTYTDVAGVQGAVTVTADNPILDQAGINSRVLIIDAGTATPATAQLFAAEALVLTNSQARVAGSIDIIAPIANPSGPMAPWLLRPGIDRIRVGDAPSTDAWGGLSDFPLTRVETSLSSSGITVSVELGSGADLVETLQSRAAASSALAAQGGI